MSPRIGRGAAAGAEAPAPVVFRWDLDKTYLCSEFDSFRKMVRIPFERPEDKVDEPGVVELIKGLAAAAERAGRRPLVYFISASPPQIGRAVREKLARDGIRCDGIVFKNQLQNLVRGKFRYLREHVGFKVSELLRSRLTVPQASRELLFGDDWESDPLSYSLYADVIAGRVGRVELERLLARIGVDPALERQILGLAEEVPRADAVERIFIKLERPTPPASFRHFGRRVVPAFNYFQTAAVLAAAGYLGAGEVARVGRALLERGFTLFRLANSLDDLVRRGELEEAVAGRLRRSLVRSGLGLPEPSGAAGRKGAGGGWVLGMRAWVRRMAARRRGGKSAAAPAGDGVKADYDAVLEAWGAGRARRRRAARGGRR